MTPEHFDHLLGLMERSMGTSIPEEIRTYVRALEAEARQARRQALEEAAALCDVQAVAGARVWSACATTLGRAIRALMEKP